MALYDASDDECGCAPTPREQRLLWPAVSRRGALGLAAISLAAIGGVVSPLISPAFGAQYPSWPEVEATTAPNNAAATTDTPTSSSPKSTRF